MDEEKYNYRLTDAEVVLDACGEAFQLIPVWALKRGHQWMPSEEALRVIELAKDEITKYNKKYHNGNGNNNS